MQIIQNLEIRGDAPTVQRWLDRVSAAVNGGWARDCSREDELPGYHCFARSGTDATPEARLYLITEPGGLRVANIVPNGRNLTIEQYNSILREFHDRYAGPAASEVGARVTITRSSLSLDEALSADVARKLRHFSELANKSTGAGHPSDHERWLDFLVAAHRSRAELDPGTLARLLAEELGWPEDTASALAEDYASALDLLRFYDSGQRAA